MIIAQIKAPFRSFFALFQMLTHYVWAMGCFKARDHFENHHYHFTNISLPLNKVQEDSISNFCTVQDSYSRFNCSNKQFCCDFLPLLATIWQWQICLQPPLPHFSVQIIRHFKKACKSKKFSKNMFLKNTCR